ncbi:uncharacterized protein [Euwallacea similis]|uniref:uncharacterized protein isoform X2 n=1 Tax=Euwallacea similis TaxID=1736056 RepID=UPI00344F982A
MDGFSYHKINDKVGAQNLNQIFGDKLNLNHQSVMKSCLQLGVGQSNELFEFASTQFVQYNGSNTSPSKLPNHYITNNKKSKRALEVDRVILEINQGYKVVVLLRGLPGSGKSTLAKYILENTIGYTQDVAKSHILSTDDFFFQNNIYYYDPKKIQEAHGWNHQRAFRAMSKGYSPVIIDNTNVKMWEMKPYAMMATDYGYYLEILEPDTHWSFNDKELEKRNKHGVPRNSIKSMLDRYEKNITPVKLLSAYGCTYKYQKPPQYRLHPPVGHVFNGTKESNNFMQFCDSSKQALNGTAASTSVDDILMQSNDASCLKTPVLEPIHTTKMKQSLSLNENFKSWNRDIGTKVPQGSNLFDNINAWGIDKTDLQSWDIVTPLKINETEANVISLIDSDEENQVVETREMSTSTEEEDFYISKNICTLNPPLGYKILVTCNRDINHNVSPKQPVAAKKLMIEKSCNTIDFLDDHQMHLENLGRVFPNMAPRTIRYWYLKCNRDFDCTIELLLTEKEEVINMIIAEETAAATENSCESIVEKNENESLSPETPQSAKNKRKSISPSECENLKKCIESKITISEEHYSQHLLKVKQCKYGPSTSKSEPVVIEPESSQQSHERSRPSTPVDSEIKYDSDDPEWEFINSDTPQKTEQPEQMQTIEMNLGENFVKQLEDKFGDPNLTYPKGFLPVIQIPVALAQQIYTFYIESVYQQMDIQNAVMDELVKEDEEFARKLQESEEEDENAVEIVKPPLAESTEIPDIMREQWELGKKQKENEKWKEENPDTFAARLTRDKLFKAFPKVDKNVLIEILHAHENIYKDTVETLLASTGHENIKGDIETIKNPPLTEGVIQEMWEAHDSCINVPELTEAYSAQALREQANIHLEKRSKLYEKAQQYYQSRMKEVAQYYSNLAAEQTRLFHSANSLASTAFLDEHSKRLENFNTIDLHFLYVREAIPHLDIFLDRIISLLRASTTKNSESCQIITGRGKNSSNGVAKLRPAVISRLKERKIGTTSFTCGCSIKSSNDR